MRPLLAVLLSGLLAAPAVAEDPPAKTVGSAEAPTEDYRAAVREFKAVIAASKARNVHNLPFLRVHPNGNRRSILLIHGLGDSPYYMAELGEIFHSRGYNVVGILLPGHGTKPEDMHTVKMEDWREAVDVGLGIAKRLGGETSIGGLSTGGALALDAVARHFPGEKNHSWVYGDVYLFSPAIDLSKKNRYGSKTLCALGKKWLKEHPPSDYYYDKVSANGVCQLIKVIEANEANRAVINESLQGHGVFVVQSMADTTINPVATVKLVGALPEGVSGTFDPYDKSEGIKHDEVTRSWPQNARFASMKASLNEFIDRCTVGNAPEEGAVRKPTLYKP